MFYEKVDKKGDSCQLTNVRTYRGAGADSHHFMVAITPRQRIRNIKEKEDKFKWNVERLNDEKERKHKSRDRSATK